MADPDHPDVSGAPESAGAARGGRPPTRWGDREQRRVDILDAAREHIADRGYLSLNMRDLAAAAGLSPATLYSYFANKDELFVTLYAEAMRRYVEEIRPGCETDQGLVPLLEHLVSTYVGLYRAYGQYFTVWSVLRADADLDESPFPKELILELRAAAIELARLVWRSIRAAAAHDDLRVVDDDLGPALLWSTLNGVADHLTSERRTLDTFDSERLVGFAAARLARALTEPLHE
jgi:AcrR family transcriptional regulator